MYIKCIYLYLYSFTTFSIIYLFIDIYGYKHSLFPLSTPLQTHNEDLLQQISGRRRHFRIHTCLVPGDCPVSGSDVDADAADATAASVACTCVVIHVFRRIKKLK